MGRKELERVPRRTLRGCVTGLAGRVLRMKLNSLGSAVNVLGGPFWGQCSTNQ